MTDIFFWLIYWGGVVAYPNEKRGFFARLGWPIELGEEIYYWIKREK